jgi:hypothetical protein
MRVDRTNENLTKREKFLSLELSREKPMMGANAAVGGTKRDPAGRAVGNKQTVERITGPVESQSMAN